MRRMGLAMVTCALAACVPSRGELFDPVRTATQARFGVSAVWHEDGRARPAAVAARVAELLAQPLTAESAVAIAILDNRGLQAAYEALGAAGAQLARAHTPANPEGEARVTRRDGETHVELTVVESVTDLLGLWSASQAADAELRAARRKALARTVQVAARARLAYYGVVAAGARVALQVQLAEAAATSAELAGRLHAAGNLADLEEARERAFAAQARLAAREARAELEAARARVDVALGLAGAEVGSWTVASALPAPPAAAPARPHLVADALDASLDLDALRWELRAAGYEVQAARWKSFLPELGVGVAANHDAGWALGPAVTLSVPLFDWGQGERAAAWSEVRRLQHRYAARAGQIEAAARAVVEREAAAYERATALEREVLPLHDRILAEAVKQWNAMNLGPFELVIVRRERLAAELDHVDALAAYWSAEAEIEALLGGALVAGGDLDAEEGVAR